MSNRRYIFDIEGDNLLVEATQIWLAVAIDADSGQEHRFTQDQLPQFAELLANANELIGHNIIMYDIPVCERLLGIKINAKLVDTLVVSRMMYPDRYNKKNLSSPTHCRRGVTLGSRRSTSRTWFSRPPRKNAQG